MRIQKLFLFKIYLAALVMSLAILSQNSASGATTNVAYGGAAFTFRPAVITVNVGDTVVFSNAGGLHTVTGTGSDPFCGTGTTNSCTHTFNTAGSFAYQCLPHAGLGMTGLVNVVAASVPPTISLTAPTSGTVFAAPANVNFSTITTAGSGSITNVQYFANITNFLGSTTTSPFNFTASNLTAGTYSLTGTAQNSIGLATTSSPVSITVVSPVAISNYLAQVTNGQLTFEHTANPGLKYVVETSGDLTSWSPTATNTASSNSVHVSDTFQLGTLRFYRVGRLPNP